MKVELIKKAKELELDLGEDKIVNLMVEIYSDLFAINNYHTNYFFAFFFHEVVMRDVDELVGQINNYVRIGTIILLLPLEWIT